MTIFFSLTYAICIATRASMGFLKTVSQFGAAVNSTESLEITHTVPKRQNACFMKVLMKLNFNR